MPDILKSLYPQTQWSMSAADNEYGLSLPEIMPQDITPLPQSTFEISGMDTDEPLQFSTGDQSDNLYTILRDFAKMMQPQQRSAADITDALKLFQPSETDLAKAHVKMYQGAVMKTVASASDLFNTLIGAYYGPDLIRQQKNIGLQNYQNQMTALDNQVLYVKNQLADRFNKTVENNIMNLAAKNLRVTSGNVLELSKDTAQEMTEDMAMLDSNARLKKIALETGMKQTKESAKYAEKQMWVGLAQSAAKLGLSIATGGGTGESWGNLYSNYSKSQKLLQGVKNG